MNLLVWNCRGLENLHTVKELGNIIRAKDPSIVFLVETWANEARLERVLHNINFHHSGRFVVGGEVEDWRCSRKMMFM